MALLHQMGWSAEQNAKAKIIYSSGLEKKATAGDPDAQADLGMCYFEGLGVAKDIKQAVKWYEKSAKQGHAWAQASLGKCYQTGTGVAKDDQKSATWYRKSAEQGNKTVS